MSREQPTGVDTNITAMLLTTSFVFVILTGNYLQTNEILRSM